MGETDLISRQAARHALCKAVHKGEDIPCENQTASCLWTGTRVCDYVREIDALPTVQPERKMGEWIYNSPVTMKCNQCGFVIKDWDWHRFKFCPNCDCDMRGEQK